MEVNNPEQAWACQKFYTCELLKIVPVFFFTITKSRWKSCHRVFKLLFEKLSGTVTMINGLNGVIVLRGGILVILLDSCVLEFFSLNFMPC